MGRRGYRFQQAQRNAQSRQQQVRRKPRKLTIRKLLGLSGSVRS
jgi:hypothetical protein